MPILDLEEIKEDILKELEFFRQETLTENQDRDFEKVFIKIENKLKEIKQRIRKACEFYLRYKDNPLLLWKEAPEYRKELEKRFGINERWFDELNVNKIKTVSELYKQFVQRISEINDSLYNQHNYNEWLFKLVFKEVFEDEIKSR